MQNNTNLVVVTQVPSFHEIQPFSKFLHLSTSQGKSHKSYHAGRQSCWGGVLQVLKSKKRLCDEVTIRYGREFEVFASKEVVVACGTVASPKLLLLSGIGPAPHLNQVLVLVRLSW